MIFIIVTSSRLLESICHGIEREPVNGTLLTATISLLDLASSIGNYTERYHRWLGPFDNTDPLNCVTGMPLGRSSQKRYETSCCGGQERSYTLFNKLGAQKCCADGHVRNQCD